jgi:hydrogenase expression/formation protein HypC
VCLAVPGRVIRLESRDGGVVAEVDFGNAVREVNLALVPDAAVGDFVVVHSGLAVRRMSPSEAEAVTRLLAEAFDE